MDYTTTRIFLSRSESIGGRPSPLHPHHYKLDTMLTSINKLKKYKQYAYQLGLLSPSTRFAEPINAPQLVLIGSMSRHRSCNPRVPSLLLAGSAQAVSPGPS